MNERLRNSARGFAGRPTRPSNDQLINLIVLAKLITQAFDLFPIQGCTGKFIHMDPIQYYRIISPNHHRNDFDSHMRHRYDRIDGTILVNKYLNRHAETPKTNSLCLSATDAVVFQRELVILPQRVTFPIVGQQDARQVGMADELHATQVVNLALVPVSGPPEPSNRRHFG
jgi:hypothetical protein